MRDVMPDGLWIKSAARTFNPESVQITSRCVVDTGSYSAWRCQNDPNAIYCFTIRFDSTYDNGNSSRYPVSDDCRQLPDGVDHGVICTETTIHYEYFPDFSCASPSPTPIVTCLHEGDVYVDYGLSCCPGLTPQGGLCEPAPSPSPSPTCLPPGSITFGYPPCCSGTPVNYVCPNPSPTPCGPVGFVCFTNDGCCSHNCVNNQCIEPSPTPDAGAGCDAYEAFKCGQYGGSYDNSTCTCTGGRCDYAAGESFCDEHDGDWIASTCTWHYTPIIIDVTGDGFHLTANASGVFFDLAGLGIEKWSWTDAAYSNAFLAMDRNGNGIIDNGTELFGNVTVQPSPPAGVSRNGFLALAEYDKTQNGGNGDGLIDSGDIVFSRLRLWQDSNHNGISEPSELHPLSEFDIESLALDFRESRRADLWGNIFRYRAKVYGANRRDLGRWAYDVILQSADASNKNPQKQIARTNADGRKNLLRLLGIEIANFSERNWLHRSD